VVFTAELFHHKAMINRRPTHALAGRCAALVVAALVGWSAVASGVILYRTDDPTANTSEPTGDLAGSGWQFEGAFGEFLGTAIAPHFFITAQHIGPADKFVYHGTTYSIVRSFDDPASDLRIYQVGERFTSYAPLYTGSGEVGEQVVVIGRGTRRGPAKVVDGQTRGWEWGTGDHVQRWGQNQVASIKPLRAGSEALYMLFDQQGLPNEAHLSSGDSGGAVFVKDGSTWKLAGINLDVDFFASGPDGATPYGAAMFDERGLYRRDGSLVTGSSPVPSGFYSTRITSRLAWITSIIGRRLVNISSRVSVGRDERVCVGGFIVQGNAKEAVRVVIRGLGPSLVSGGSSFAQTITDPVLEIHDGTGALIATNDNWGEAQGSGEIEQSGLVPDDGREAALSIELAPGNYTAVLRDVNGGSGIGLIEVYDLDSVSDSRLLNLSARAYVGSGDHVLIGGLIVRTVSQRLLLRALGPELAARGVADELADPALELHDSSGAILAANDNWKDAANRSEIAATGLAPTDDREAAILATPQPSSYTAIVRGANGAVGIALLEAYLVN
jgi:hypothetical protein